MRKDAWLTWGWMLAFLLYGLVLAVQPDTPPERSVSTQLVWGNQRSGIYHLVGCRHYPTLQQTLSGSHWRAFRTPEAAEQAGYRQALTCPPDMKQKYAPKSE